VLGRSRRLGRVAPGYDGDVVILDADDWRHVSYHLGGRVAAAVFKRGELL
jgi:imidazolonepropionase